MLSRARAIRATVAPSVAAAGRFVAAGAALRAAVFVAVCLVVFRVFFDMIGPCGGTLSEAGGRLQLPQMHGKIAYPVPLQLGR
jgi:hypothetical protein